MIVVVGWWMVEMVVCCGGIVILLQDLLILVVKQMVVFVKSWDLVFDILVMLVFDDLVFDVMVFIYKCVYGVVVVIFEGCLIGLVCELFCLGVDCFIWVCDIVVMDYVIVLVGIELCKIFDLLEYVLVDVVVLIDVDGMLVGVLSCIGVICVGIYILVIDSVGWLWIGVVVGINGDVGVKV